MARPSWKTKGILALILIGLLTYTYFTEELGQSFFTEKDQSFNALKSNTQNIQRISFNDYSIVIKAREAFLNEYPVDEKIINQFLQKLSRFKVERVLNNEKKQLYAKIKNKFSNKLTFEFVDQKQEFFLGPKLKLDETFYMKIKITKNNEVQENLVIGKFDIIKDFAYDPSVKNSGMLYDQMLSLFKVPRDLFYDKSISLPIKALKSIQFSSKRNRAFSLDIINKQTTPKAYMGLNYNLKAIEGLTQWLMELSGQNIYQGSLSDLSEEIGRIKIIADQSLELLLFKKFKKKSGFFLSRGDFIYELSEASAKIFLSNLQDYWLKRPFGNGIITKQDIHFSLSNKKEKLGFIIPNGKGFIVKSSDPDKQVNHENMGKLFVLLFGKSDKDEAFRVSKKIARKDTILKNHPMIDMSLAKKNLGLLYYSNELLVWDKSTNLVYHYLVGTNWIKNFELRSFLK